MCALKWPDGAKAVAAIVVELVNLAEVIFAVLLQSDSFSAFEVFAVFVFEPWTRELVGAIVTWVIAVFCAEDSKGIVLRTTSSREVFDQPQQLSSKPHSTNDSAHKKHVAEATCRLVLGIGSESVQCYLFMFYSGCFLESLVQHNYGSGSGSGTSSNPMLQRETLGFETDLFSLSNEDLAAHLFPSFAGFQILALAAQFCAETSTAAKERVHKHDQAYHRIAAAHLQWREQTIAREVEVTLQLKETSQRAERTSGPKLFGISIFPNQAKQAKAEKLKSEEQIRHDAEQRREEAAREARTKMLELGALDNDHKHDQAYHRIAAAHLQRREQTIAREVTLQLKETSQRAERTSGPKLFGISIFPNQAKQAKAEKLKSEEQIRHDAEQRRVEATVWAAREARMKMLALGALDNDHQNDEKGSQTTFCHLFRDVLNVISTIRSEAPQVLMGLCFTALAQDSPFRTQWFDIANGCYLYFAGVALGTNVFIQRRDRIIGGFNGHRIIGSEMEEYRARYKRPIREMHAYLHQRFLFPVAVVSVICTWYVYLPTVFRRWGDPMFDTQVALISVVLPPFIYLGKRLHDESERLAKKSGERPSCRDLERGITFLFVQCLLAVSAVVLFALVETIWLTIWYGPWAMVAIVALLCTLWFYLVVVHPRCFDS
jgi:hypothetical protein